MKDLLTSEVVAIGNEIRIVGSEEMLAYTGETEATQAIARERAAYIAQALNGRRVMDSRVRSAVTGYFWLSNVMMFAAGALFCFSVMS